MTISSETTFTGPLIANGVTTAFPFTFVAMGADEVAAYGLDGAGAEITLPDFTVGLAGAPPSIGTVTFDTAPADGTRIWIVSAPNFLQEIAFENGSRWLAGPVNEANDRAALRALMLKRDTDRSIKMPIGEAGVTLPPGSGPTLYTSVNTLAAISGDIESVAEVAQDVPIVAGRDADIATVAARDADIGTVATRDADIGTVADRDTDIGIVADRDAAIGTVAARDADIEMVAARDADIGALADRTEQIDALAPREADLAALGPIAAEIEITADNMAAIIAAPDAAATIVEALATTAAAVRRLTRATEPLVVDGNSILSREPDQIIGPWSGGTTYGVFGTGDSTSVGVSGGAPATPASVKSLMFNGGIIRPISRTSLVAAQEATLETGMTSIGEAFYTLAGASAPPLLLATAGTSGSGINYHMPGATGNVELATLITDARDLVAAAGGRLVVPMVFFSEGTNDEAYVVGQPNAVQDYHISEYVDKLIIIAEGIQTQVKSLLGQDRPPRIALVQNSNWTYNGGQTANPVRNVQGRIGLGHRLAFFLRPDLFVLVGAQYHCAHEAGNTGLHPSGAGYIRRASDVARALYAEMYGRDSRPLHEIGIDHVVGTDSAIINYYSPSGSVVSDTVTVSDPNGAWGFEVGDTNTAVPLTIASKAIAGTSVILRFNRNTVSFPDFAYALTGVANGGSGPSGARGNIRDTSNPPAWAIYTSTKVLP